jgi:hypothetical protein
MSNLQLHAIRFPVLSCAAFLLFYEVIGERIRQSLATRGAGLRFIQIFNYVYQDGAPMFTVGGIVGTEDDERALRGAGIFSHRFVRRSKNYLEISGSSSYDTREAMARLPTGRLAYCQEAELRT